MWAGRARASRISTTNSRSTPTTWWRRTWVIRRRPSARWTSPVGLEDPARAQALFCWNINIAASNPEQARLQRGARARGPVHGRGRPVPDRHHRSRRLRAAGGQLPRVRRSRLLLLRPHPVGPGEGRRPARRGAAEHRDLPPPGGRHGLTRARAARVRRRHDRGAAGAVGSDRDVRQLAAVGTVPLSAEPVVQFAELEFPTPSGRIEIASAPPRPMGIRAFRSRGPTSARPRTCCGC